MLECWRAACQCALCDASTRAHCFHLCWSAAPLFFCVGGVPGLVYPVAVVLLLRFAASCLPVLAVHHTHVAFICDASGDFMELRFLACCPCSTVSCLCAKLAWSHSELLIDLVSLVRFNPSVFREWLTVTTHCDPL